VREPLKREEEKDKEWVFCVSSLLAVMARVVSEPDTAQLRTCLERCYIAITSRYCKTRCTAARYATESRAPDGSLYG